MLTRTLKVNQIVDSVSITHSFDKEELIAVNTSDVLEGHFIEPKLLPINELKGQFKKTIQKDDILFSEIRPANKRYARVDFEDTANYVVSTKLMVLRKFNKDVDLDYFYYWLTSDINLKILQARAENRICSFPQITFDLLSEYDVPIPNMEYQKNIAHILKSLDEKISNNKKINIELESIARDLYNYWFLQFEFPNKEGKPYRTSGGKMVWNEELKREIPKGWEVKNAYEIADIKTGKEDANHATKNGKYPFFTCANDVLRCDDYKFDGNVILIAGNGDFNVKHYNGKFNAYQRTYVITPHNDKYVGVFHLSCKQTVEKFIKGSNGSIVKFITLRDIQNIKILDCKNDKLLEPFNVFLEKIDLLKKENQELSSLRDFLLPLLMNGQVKFKDK
jgi:type I restriction enzyme S subunit